MTEHRAMRVCCGRCTATTQAAFPEGVQPGTQYGSGVASLGVYAGVYQLLPLERTTELLGDVAGCELSEGTLVNMLAVCARKVSPIEAQIKQALTQAATVRFDETGIRVVSKPHKLHWLHVACTDVLTYYAVDPQRGRPAQERIGILPVFKGNAVHDALASYLVWTCDHGLCNAHLLRELIGLEESTCQRWPTRMKVLLLDMKAAVDTAVQHHQSALPPEAIAGFEVEYDRLVRRAIRANPRPKYQIGQRGRPRASPARNLAERLRDHKPSVLRFLHDL